MFDFFAEIIEFLSQVVERVSWSDNFITNLISSSAASVESVIELFGNLDSRIVWMVPASFAVLIFGFVRGR